MILKKNIIKNKMNEENKRKREAGLGCCHLKLFF